MSDDGAGLRDEVSVVLTPATPDAHATSVCKPGCPICAPPPVEESEE